VVVSPPSTSISAPVQSLPHHREKQRCLRDFFWLTEPVQWVLRARKAARGLWSQAE
jgi:hypothetical protein